jgi:hypothetical protein
VVHQPGLGPTPRDRHLQRLDDELGAHVVSELPADDRAREQVLDGGEVAAALPRLEVRDVGAPQHVGRRRPEAALDEVVGDTDARNADRRSAAPAADQPRDPGLAHQSLDTLS